MQRISENGVWRRIQSTSEWRWESRCGGQGGLCGWWRWRRGAAWRSFSELSINTDYMRVDSVKASGRKEEEKSKCKRSWNQKGSCAISPMRVMTGLPHTWAVLCIPSSAKPCTRTLTHTCMRSRGDRRRRGCVGFLWQGELHASRAWYITPEWRTKAGQTERERRKEEEEALLLSSFFLFRRLLGGFLSGGFFPWRSDKDRIR